MTDNSNATSSSSESSGESKVMKTYVPAEQKEEWVEHADALGMSQSEFVRTMIQSGRRSFEIDQPRSSGGSDSGKEIVGRVRDVLQDSGALDWDALLAELTESVEEDLEAALGELQEMNEVRYSGRDGGYMLTTDGSAGDGE